VAGPHTKEQLSQKLNAIDISVDSFVEKYHEGFFEKNKDLLYHEIESIYQLIQELKSG